VESTALLDRPGRKKRLDEILLAEGFITDAEVQEALLRQKALGGKFGSQLLYHRYIDEASLVKALSVQFNCDGVTLADREIPESVVKLVPKKSALSRKVMPFEYNATRNILKVACEDPTDHALIRDLDFAGSGKRIQLYVAAELALNTVIAKYYLGRDVSLDDNLLLEIPAETADAGRVAIAQDSSTRINLKQVKPAVLLVTDETFAPPILQSILERDNYSVAIAGSIPEAVQRLGERQYQTILVRDSVEGDHDELLERARKMSPETTVRHYQSGSSLLLPNECGAAEVDLSLKNLDLFTSLLSAKAKLPVNHSGRAGQYADRLCRKLGVPDQDRLYICNAAYMHDLAWFYQGVPDEDKRQVIQRTIRLLASLNYSPIVLDILHAMYTDLDDSCPDRLPLSVLGGNILTMVDIFCDSIPQNDRLSPEKIDAVRKKLRDLAGKMFLPEIVEGFIAVIQEEILHLHTTHTAGQVMIFAEDLSWEQPLVMRLKNEGYRTVSHSSPMDFIELYQRSEPDMIILALVDDPESIAAFIDQLADMGIAFDRTPAFLLTHSSAVSQLADILARDVEDILALDDDLDLLIGKIHKMQLRINARAVADQGEPLGARGSLAEMNLIDLLQAMGPSRKTARITVNPGRKNSGSLIIFLDQGTIVFAMLRHITGAEAVYEGLTWTDGTWTAEAIEQDDLPEPNNHLSNESILMEGCRLMDERAKAGQLL